jgi:hypothetical protein
VGSAKADLEHATYADRERGDIPTTARWARAEIESAAIGSVAPPAP